MGPADKPAKPPSSGPAPSDKEAKLAQALRANLRRRKAADGAAKADKKS